LDLVFRVFLLHVLTPLVRVRGGEGKLRSAIVAKSYNGADLLVGTLWVAMEARRGCILKELCPRGK
jgi:hypothetical protein